MTHRLLLVEQSTTMRNVMEKHATSLGFTVDSCSTYSQARQSLEHQFQQFGEDYSGVIFGWPTDPQDDAAELAQRLESSAHKDLPVVVMSTDMRAEARAWIAGRGNTTLLGWKEYQGLQGQLHGLLDIASNEALVNDTDAERPVNDDIHLLVVDDSATIRYSMRDLFQSHGYAVTLVATHEEAMRAATSQNIDIAVLDYYLTESTGDVLCRELLASDQSGDIVCTILTGTYSDHIIKRSLRAGAVECMFKNESSELLLGRINAISEFVRQKRQLEAELLLLEDVIESLAGAVLLVSNEQKIIYINTAAIDELGLSEASVLIDQPAQSVLEADDLAASGKVVHAATWTLPDNSTIDVNCQHCIVKPSGHRLVRFAQRSQSIAGVELADLQTDNQPVSIVRSAISQFSLADDAEPFLLQMQRYLDVARSAQGHGAKPATEMRVSLLLLDIFLQQTDDAELALVSDDEEISAKVRNTLNGLISHENHVLALSGSRYAFLLGHAEESQAYVLTRKVMQRCLESINADGTPDDVPTLACTGSLVGLTKNAAQPLDVLLKHTFNGLELVNRREPNQALLLDVRRLLKAYPTA